MQTSIYNIRNIKVNVLTIQEFISIRDMINERISDLEHLLQLMNVENLNLSVRVYNILKAHNLNSIKDAVDYGVDNIGLFKNAGPKTVGEIRAELERILNMKVLNFYFISRKILRNNYLNLNFLFLKFNDQLTIASKCYHLVRC